MGGQVKYLISLVGIGIVLAACATTQQASQEDKLRNEFKVRLAERQVARRRETAKHCARVGVYVPDAYEQKGGGLLEEVVNSRPPCGLSAQERAQRAEADHRETWKEVVGKPLPPEVEWLLAVRGRLAIWLDAEGLTPAEARTALREAQWIVAGADDSAGTSERASSSGPQYFTSLDSALNQALAAEGVACRKNGKKHPCF